MVAVRLSDGTLEDRRRASLSVLTGINLFMDPGG